MSPREVFLALQGAIRESDIKRLMEAILSRALEGDNVAAKIYMQALRDVMTYNQGEIESEADKIRAMILEAASRKRKQIDMDVNLCGPGGSD